MCSEWGYRNDEPLKPYEDVSLEDYNRGFRAYLDHYFQRGNERDDYVPFDHLSGSEQRQWIAHAPKLGVAQCPDCGAPMQREGIEVGEGGTFLSFIPGPWFCTAGHREREAGQ